MARARGPYSVFVRPGLPWSAFNAECKAVTAHMRRHADLRAASRSESRYKLDPERIYIQGE